MEPGIQVYGLPAGVPPVLSRVSACARAGQWGQGLVSELIC